MENIKKKNKLFYFIIQMPTKKETLAFIKENDLKKALGISSPSSMSVQDLNKALDKFTDKSTTPSSLSKKWKRLKLKDPLTPQELETSAKSVKKKALLEGTLGGASKAERKDPTIKSGGLDKFFARDLKKGRVYEVFYYGKKKAKVLDFKKGKLGLIERAEVELPDGKKVTLPIKKFLKLEKATDIEDEIEDLMDADERVAFMKKIGRIKDNPFEPLVMATPSQEIKKKSLGVRKKTFKEENAELLKKYLNPAIKSGDMGDVRDALMLYNQLRVKYNLEPMSNQSIENFIKTTKKIVKK